MKTTIFVAIANTADCTRWLEVMTEVMPPGYKLVHLPTSDELKKLPSSQPLALALVDLTTIHALGWDWFLNRSTSNVGFVLIDNTQDHVIDALQSGFIDFHQTEPQAMSIKALLDRCRKRLTMKAEYNDVIIHLMHELKQKDQGKKRITINDMDGITFVHPNEIIRCEADRNYTFIYLTTGGKMVTSKSLKEYEGLLEQNDFIRLHHSHLINLHHVIRFNRTDGKVVMRDQSEVEVSRRKKADFLERLNQL